MVRISNMIILVPKSHKQEIKPEKEVVNYMLVDTLDLIESGDYEKAFDTLRYTDAKDTNQPDYIVARLYYRALCMRYGENLFASRVLLLDIVDVAGWEGDCARKLLDSSFNVSHRESEVDRRTAYILKLANFANFGRPI